MALPAGVTTCLASMKAPMSFGGEQTQITLEITPSVRLVHTATGTPLVDFFDRATSDDDGTAEVALPHTSQPGFQDEAGNAFINWHYTARVRIQRTGQPAKVLPLFDFQLPAGQSSVDLAKVPRGIPALPTVAPILGVTSFNGQTGEADTYLQLARTPEVLIYGPITLTNGAPTSAAVTWPDGTVGVFTGTPSVAFPGSIDAYTITRGTTTYTQPAVTRDSAGNITNQPAIIEESA